MLVIPGRHARPQPRWLRTAPQPTLGTLDHHPPVLRLDPEHGVGRLSRWFVFFCSGGHGIPLALGVIGIHHLPNPSSSLPLHKSSLGTGAADTHTCAHIQDVLTLQAWASSMAAFKASRGFSMTRPAWPEKSMATRVLSETLLWEENRRRRREGVRRAALSLYPHLP